MTQSKENQKILLQGDLTQIWWQLHPSILVKVVDCADIFDTSPTDSGMCCSFNMEKTLRWKDWTLFSELSEISGSLATWTWSKRWEPGIGSSGTSQQQNKKTLEWFDSLLLPLIHPNQGQNWKKERTTPDVRPALQLCRLIRTYAADQTTSLRWVWAQ